MNRVVPFAIVLMLSACAAGAEGEWPSLARRPGEVESGSTLVEATPPAEPAATGPAGNAAVPVVAIGRIDEAARNFEQVSTRWKQQSSATQAAVAAARGAAVSSQPWSHAQLELTRLERLGAELSDLRSQLGAVAGDLAVASTQGVDVKAALDRAGALIARVDAARDEHRRVFEAAQRALAR